MNTNQHLYDDTYYIDVNDKHTPTQKGNNI